MHFAKHAAATALVDGWKSVEIVQAYILMAVYAVPSRRAEEDKSWVYIGLATRYAIDLGLHLPDVGVTRALTSKEAVAGVDAEMSSEESSEREKLNGTRTWLVCCVLDKSLSVLHGKPSMAKDQL